MHIKLENVSLVYQEGTPFATRALDGISLEVAPGERLGIAGPMGSGKSTLLGVMSGIMKPAAGRVMHDGKPLGKREHPGPGRVGLGLQAPENCLFERTVYDDVAFAPRRMGLAAEAVAARAVNALKLMGLDPRVFGDRNPFSLSAGEQRRVALAGVIASEPQALLLDEPTAYLDPASRRDLIRRLLAINEQKGTTIIVVGHDMDEMSAFARKMAIIDKGRLAVEGDVRSLLTDAGLLSTYHLKEPGTVRLSHLLAEYSGNEVEPVLDEQAAAELLIQAARDGREG
jgi:energy-coupling factor transport system ATP-binding protein